MRDLKVPVTIIPKIGPRYEHLLSKLNIYTIEDLLNYFPYRYEDLSKRIRISELKENDVVTLELTLESINNVFTRNGKKITKARGSDETGTIELIWFNQHYIANNFAIGNKYFFSGKVSVFNKKLTLVSPTYESVSENALNTGRIIPIYSEVAGINSKWIRSKVDFVLKMVLSLEPIAELLPKETLEQENLITLDEALHKIHFPNSQQEIDLAKRRLAFDELLLELLKVENRKQLWQNELVGIHFEYDQYASEIDQFINSLPFKLTEGQVQVLSEIHNDLKRTRPMNRLLEGDVGSGKTMVAIIAAFVSHLNGYKTLYMAPTEILAKQHFLTFKKFLEASNIEVELHTGNTKTDLNSLDNSIIIGTHALIFSKEKIKNVGLVIIDEQHRFGVEQRTKLLMLGTEDKKPNLLSMTATPIPRTLALTLYGDMDLSILKGVPNKDKKITTKVIPETLREKTFRWIDSYNQQAFVVCPFIEESDSENFENVKAAEAEFEKLRNGYFKNKRVALLHGKMAADEKQILMEDFKNKKYDILVSTPVIEVGVDIPEAAIIVIESAERYGLASLHQLRGRVGRGTKEGFCFLFMSGFSKKSYARLKNLEEIDSGIELAEIDMKYRGQGDVFGRMQHGFKSFKLADLTDLELVEKAKYWAERLYKDLDKHRVIREKISSFNNSIHNN